MVNMNRILLVALISTLFTLCHLPSVTNATATVIYIDPISVTLDVGKSFSANVSIVDVYDLVGWQFELYYNNTILNGTEVTEGDFLKSGGFTFGLANFTDKYNATHGRLLASYVLVGTGVSGVNGDGVLAIVNFTTQVQGGPCDLKLCNTKLLDSNHELISHQTGDGTVTVIPEFQSMITIVLYAVAALLVIILKKFRAYADDENGGKAFEPPLYIEYMMGPKSAPSTTSK